MSDQVTTEPKAVESKIPPKPEPKEVGFEFAQDVLVINASPAWCDDLVRLVERLNLWGRATLSNGESGEYHHVDRNNDSIALDQSLSAELVQYQTLLLPQVAHQCAMVYKALNKFTTFSADTNYQLLRYKPGQHFHEHVDHIVGHPSWGRRQLSFLLYLNDDYEGGELWFPRQKLRLKPKAGDAVLFPSHYTHPHASLDVSRGVKYSVVTWFV